MDKLDIGIVIGQIGSGKTTVSNKLEDRLGFVHLDRDTIRQELAFASYDPLNSSRIDRIVWDRIRTLLKDNRTVIIGAAAAMKLERRLQYYSKISEIAAELGRRVEVVMIECVCEPEEAKRRIALRSSDQSAATSDPADYDKVASVSTPVTLEELEFYPWISFMRLDTQRGVVDVITEKESHGQVLKKIIKVLV